MKGVYICIYVYKINPEVNLVSQLVTGEGILIYFP